MGQQVTMPAGKKKSQSFIHSFIHSFIGKQCIQLEIIDRSIHSSLYFHIKRWINTMEDNGRNVLSLAHLPFIYDLYIMYMLYLSYAMLCYAMLWCSRQIDSTSLSLPICMCTWMHHCTTVCCAVISILHMKSQLLSVVFGMLFNSYSR